MRRETPAFPISSHSLTFHNGPMTKKTRYFLFGAVGALIVGLGGGLIAYLAYNRGGVPDGLPLEVRYVPANAEVVAFANIQAVVKLDLRRVLMPTIEGGEHKGRQMMHEFAGVDFEKQVHHIVAYVEPYTPAPAAGTAAARVSERIDPRSGVLRPGQNRAAHPRSRGRDGGLQRQEDVRAPRGGQGIRGRARRAGSHRMGQAVLVRRALDHARGASGNAADITTNSEMMNLIATRPAARHGLSVTSMRCAAECGCRTRGPRKVPTVRLVSVKANVNGGMRATIRAEAGDKAAADQLRDVVRGFVSLARLQGGAQPALESTLKSIELSGTNKTVQMSFAMTPDTLRTLAPRRRERPNTGTAQPPNPPNDLRSTRRSQRRRAFF